MDEHDLRLTDEIRGMHAQQLLKNKNLPVLTEFNGDRHFTRYISAYIESKGNMIDADKFTTSLLSLSRQHAYDPIFLLAVIKTESAFNPNAIGKVGEIGLMQIKPDTAQWICDKNNIVWRGAGALKDPEYNLLIGSYYFQYLRRTLKSESFKYVTAYNMGINGLSKLNRVDKAENNYFKRVIANYILIYNELRRIKKNTMRA